VTNDRLRLLAAAETRGRWLRGISGSLLALASAGAWIGGELDATRPSDRIHTRILAGLGVAVGLGMLGAALLIDSPTQRLLNMWRSDLRGFAIAPSIAPVSGGAMIGVNGRF
jgi:hypothetical protein